jgi:hypothetical protein
MKQTQTQTAKQAKQGAYTIVRLAGGLYVVRGPSGAHVTAPCEDYDVTLDLRSAHETAERNETAERTAA